MTKTYDLSATWNFILDSDRKGLQEDYANRSELFTDTITLPGTTSEQQKGPMNPAYETGYLTEIYKFEGYAWYQREIQIDPADITRPAFLTLERTRISHVYVDGVKVGTQNSLCCSHVYDLTGFIKNTHSVLTIMTANVGYPTTGGHMTSPDTQTNWNGILGELSLKFYDTFRIRHIRTDVDREARKLSIALSVTNFGEALPVAITALALPVTIDTYDKEADASKLISLVDQAGTQLKPGNSKLSFTVDLPDSLPDWDEYDPSVIRLTCALTSQDSACSRDTISTWFGIRTFEAKDMHFYINGRKTFLRGKHDGMIFPLTGYAPMDVDGWLSHMRAAKELGINHYRCHTCCPPEAAFLAADLLGIYYQPELPFWGTFYAKDEADYPEHQESQEYLTQEGFQLMEQFGNHPSFALMSMGNELWGSPQAINELVGAYKAVDKRHLYTQGSNNFQWTPNIQPNDDFFSGVRFTIDRQIRGSYAQCDAPLGHVQMDKPGTNLNYEDAIFPSYNAKASEVSEDGMIEIQYGTGVKKVKLTDASAELIPNIPVVSHEIGQYETYPDFDEIDKYTGVLKARNFEIFRKRLEEKGLLPLAKEYFRNSGALAMQCYKEELEMALRTKDMAGFQLLDIQDFSGQGTALVGALDAFMENKGLISAAQWRRFCSDAVIQAEFASYVVASGDSIPVHVSLSWYRKSLPAQATVRIFLENAKDTCPGSCGTLACRKPLMELTCSVTEHGLNALGDFTLEIPDVTQPSIYQLTVCLDGTDVCNQYELWVYPKATALGELQDYVTTDMVGAIKRAQSGHAVVLCLSKEQNPNAIEGTYATDFWCYPMFRSISESMNKKTPIGTMGLLIDAQHPAFASFPTHTYTSPQWFDAVMHANVTILDHTDIQPVAQMIDNFERNHKLGLIYEIAIEGSSAPIIICTAPLLQLSMDGSLACGALLRSLCNYAAHAKTYPHEIAKMSEGAFYGLFASNERYA